MFGKAFSYRDIKKFESCLQGVGCQANLQNEIDRQDAKLKKNTSGQCSGTCIYCML